MNFDRKQVSSEFDEAINRIERAIRACPDEHWETSLWPVPRSDPWVWPNRGVEPVAERTDETIQRFSAFWCVAYHALWFLDFYATLDPSTFESPEYVRGGPEELGFADDGAVAVPGAPTDREALLRYADHGRRKIHDTLAAVTDEQLAEPIAKGHPRYGETIGEVLLVNLHHVQEHGQQLAALADAQPTE